MKTRVGTGFFFTFRTFDEHGQEEEVELLVTNKHVAKDALSATVVLHLGPITKGRPTEGIFELIIEDFETKCIKHPDTKIDLCAIDIGPYLQKIRKETGKKVYYQGLTDNHLLLDDELKDMFPITDVYMIGYPKGLWDKTNNLPIARKGVTASHPSSDFQGKSQGVIDIAAFKGSSGSPIISYQYSDPPWNEARPADFRLLGILWGGPTMDVVGKLSIVDVESSNPITSVNVHLGYYIKAKELLAFKKKFGAT